MSSTRMRGLFEIYSRYDISSWLFLVYFLISVYVAIIVAKRLFDVSWLDILDMLATDNSNNNGKPYIMGIVFMIVGFVSWLVLWFCTIFFLEFFQLAIRA